MSAGVDNVSKRLLVREAFSHPLSEEALNALERLVATHTSSTQDNPVNEWMTFVALLQAAGYDIEPEGIRQQR